MDYDETKLGSGDNPTQCPTLCPSPAPSPDPCPSIVPCPSPAPLPPSSAQDAPTPHPYYDKLPCTTNFGSRVSNCTPLTPQSILPRTECKVPKQFQRHRPNVPTRSYIPGGGASRSVKHIQTNCTDFSMNSSRFLNSNELQFAKYAREKATCNAASTNNGTSRYVAIPLQPTIKSTYNDKQSKTATRHIRLRKTASKVKRISKPSKPVPRVMKESLKRTLRETISNQQRSNKPVKLSNNDKKIPKRIPVSKGNNTKKGYTSKSPSQVQVHKTRIHSNKSRQISIKSIANSIKSISNRKSTCKAKNDKNQKIDGKDDAIDEDIGNLLIKCAYDLEEINEEQSDKRYVNGMRKTAINKADKNITKKSKKNNMARNKKNNIKTYVINDKKSKKNNKLKNKKQEINTKDIPVTDIKSVSTDKPHYDINNILPKQNNDVKKVQSLSNIVLRKKESDLDIEKCIKNRLRKVKSFPSNAPKNSTNKVSKRDSKIVKPVSDDLKEYKNTNNERFDRIRTRAFTAKLSLSDMKVRSPSPPRKRKCSENEDVVTEKSSQCGAYQLRN